ncbi:MAG: YfiT family bacillithiol transferase [Flavobacteriales bacterium]
MSVENFTEEHVYPIGKFKKKDHYSLEEIQAGIDRIELLPMHLSDTARLMTTEQLSASYRPGGWTGRQIIHHVADSHLNMYARLKLALTEDTPTIKPYLQDGWAEFEEARYGEIESSLTLIAILHHRIVKVLRDLDKQAFQRAYFHPEMQRKVELSEMVCSYAWHGDHHCAQLQVIRQIFPG